MAFPRTPLDLVTEIFVGDWEEVRADVYNRQPVTIRWGAPNEGGAVEPIRLTQAWNNRSGRYSSRNPTSDLYGVFGRNTPLRFAVRTVVDSFTRSVSDDWGTTDTDQDWETFSVGGAAADFDVDGSAGTMVVDGAAEHRSAWLPDDSYLDVELAATVTPSMADIDIAGGSIEPGNLLMRVQSVNLYYLARVVIDEDELVQLKLMHEDTGLTTELASVDVDGLVWFGQALRVRAHVEGQVLRAKVWDASDSEPMGWQVTVWDERITDPGGIGIRNGVAAGNTNVPVTFTVDDFEARIPLAHVELSKLPTRWDISQVDRWVPVQGYGVRRRLGQGKTPLRSSPYRYITAAAPSIFWPLEEGKDVASARPAVGTGSNLFTYEEITGSIQFGAGELAPWLPPVLKVEGTFVLEALFQNPATPTSSLAIDVVRRAKGAETDAAFGSLQFLRAATDGSTEASYALIGQWNTGAPTVELFYIEHGSGGGTLDTGSSAVANAFWDFLPHHWRIDATENGADIDVTVYLDGEEVMAGTHSGFGLQAPHSMAVDGSTVTESHFGYFTLWTDEVADVAEVYDSVTGHRGETAANRISRLCEEHSIPIVIVGDPDDSEPMGPQGTKALLPLLDEAEAADHGRLFEPRSAPGLVYRTRQTFYNQPARVELPFGVLTPFEPVDDDQHVRNDITVRREGGTSLRLAKESGPLSILDPPDGIGPVDTSATLNVDTDDVLENHAAWLRHLGTWDESRYPSIRAHLTSIGRNDQDLMYAAAVLGVRDRFTVTDPPTWLTYNPIDQLAEGGTMKIELTDWEISLNCSPHGPYEVYEIEGSGNRGRVASDHSELSEAGLHVPGAAGSYASAPDSAALSVAGDLDLRVDVTPFSWDIATAQMLIAKYTTTGNQRAYRLEVDAGGTISLTWSEDGATFLFETSDTPITAFREDGERLAIRATLDVDNGAGGYTVNFYVADTIDGPWFNLDGDFSDAGVTSIFDSNAVLEVGTANTGTSDELAGVIHAAEVRDGIDGTVVANPDFEGQDTGTTSFADAAGNTWTVNGSAEIFGEVGTDDTELGVVTLVGPEWRTTADGAATPFDLDIGGERVTVTEIVGSDPQTFTVTRSVNGVVKSHDVGTDVRLWLPGVVPL